MFKVAGGKVDRLGVACPYPSPAGSGTVRAEGIRKVYFAASCPESNPCQLPGASLIEVPRDICPALHVRMFDGQATSVCGNRYDRLVLGRRQFTDQCFARWRHAAGQSRRTSRGSGVAVGGSMHIIIVGCGRVGSALANRGCPRRRRRRGHRHGPAGLPQLGAGFNGVTMRGTGCDQEQLREAGIERCDAFVAATDSDSVNMMAAEIALRIYHVPRVVVRLYEPGHERSMRVLGLTTSTTRPCRCRPSSGRWARPAGERQESA